MDQDLSTCHDWPVKKPLSIYQSGLTANPKRMSGNSSTPLGAQNKDIGAASSSLEKVLSVQRQTLKTVRRYSYGFSRQCPVSVVVAEIAMQNIEEQAPAIFSRTIRLWLRYVDDTFTVLHTKTKSTIFTNSLTDRTRTVYHGDWGWYNTFSRLLGHS